MPKPIGQSLDLSRATSFVAPPVTAVPNMGVDQSGWPVNLTLTLEGGKTLHIEIGKQPMRELMGLLNQHLAKHPI